MPGATGAESEFAQSLATLKRRGSNLLVVGSPADTARNAACRRLLGDGVTQSRRRLFVFTDAAHTDADIGTGPVSPETTRVIDLSTDTRSTATATTGFPTATDGRDHTPNSLTTPSGRVARRRLDTDTLGSLAWAIEEEVQTFTDHGGGLASGELRLCFDSLTPVLVEHDLTAVKRFVHTVGNRVRAASGMAHYHLPVARSDPIVDDLAGVFDATIELRVCDGLEEHRWNLHHRGLKSEWIPL